MAVENVFQRRKTVGRQVFISVFVATVILSFLLLSYIGFPFMENLLMSAIVLLSAFAVSIISSVSVTNKIAPPHMGILTSSGYAAPTAFHNDSRHYSQNIRRKLSDEPNVCKCCNQVMLAGISTCPRCGWYKSK